MLERVVVTVFPAVFLAVLFIGGELSRRRHIDMGGVVPISRVPFYTSKLTIVLLWIAMVIDAWGVDLSYFTPPAALKWTAVFIWSAGFMLLFSGLFRLGDSLRVGLPRESTSLQTGGLYRVSRNPMYLGVYATALAPILRTLNPVLLLLGVFVIAVHHRIVLAEESHLRGAFGEEYSGYCRRVRRYL